MSSGPLQIPILRLPEHAISLIFWKFLRELIDRITLLKNSVLKSEIYFNDNATNQENMDLRYIGKGIGNYKSISISVYSKFLAFNLDGVVSLIPPG